MPLKLPKLSGALITWLRSEARRLHTFPNFRERLSAAFQPQVEEPSRLLQNFEARFAGHALLHVGLVLS